MNDKIHCFINPRTRTPLLKPKTPIPISIFTFRFIISRNDNHRLNKISAQRSISQSNTLAKWITVSIPSSSCLHLRSTSTLKISSRVLEVDIHHSSNAATKALSTARCAWGSPIIQCSFRPAPSDRPRYLC